MRYLISPLVLCLLSACASDSDVAMENPRTGETMTCRQSLTGLDPWSQTYACVTELATQGWVTIGK